MENNIPLRKQGMSRKVNILITYVKWCPCINGLAQHFPNCCDTWHLEGSGNDAQCSCTMASLPLLGWRLNISLKIEVRSSG